MVSSNIALLVHCGFLYEMHPSNYSDDNVFSPLNADVSVITRFDAGHELSHERDLEPHLQAMYMSSAPFSKTSRRDSIPRKPLPLYHKIPMSHESVISTQSDSSDTAIQMAKEAEVSVENVDGKQKRGWRFYGTFACLAILNLICAIDATILSVALPVRC